MKFRKLAVCAAAIMCAAAITVPAAANLTTVTESGFVKSTDQMFLVMLYSDGSKDADTKSKTNYGIDMTKITTVEVTVTADVKAGSMGGSNVGSFQNNWGGAFIMSSVGKSYDHNWNGNEYWGVNDEDFGFTAAADKPVQFNKVGDAEYKAVWTLPDNNKILADCTFCQFAIQNWGADTATIKSIVMKDADGNVVISYDADGKASLENKPIEETKKEEAAETEETKKEEAAPAEEKAEEPASAGDKDDDDDAEIDPFESYNVAAAHEKNLAFKLGDAIDLYDVLGDDWAKLATIEATFSWTPGEKWCGGAGIGAAVVNGGTWVMGPEFGAANANEAVAPDGKATQVILDITDTPIESIYSIGDDGVVSFGELQVQKWWNCDEAGAQVDSITFKDAKGKVIASLEYAATESDEPVVYAPAPETSGDVAAAGDTAAATDSSKGSPDTGIADVAAIAGIAVAAAGAVVLSRKRK